MNTPILFLGDSPDLNTGLARIGRDLATLLSRNPLFRVGYLGFGGSGSERLPFQQYVMQDDIIKGEYGWKSILKTWNDFSQAQPGIIFTIWDISRLLWLARPEFFTENYRPPLARIWSYLPIDSEGPNGRLTHMSAQTLLGIDRLLTYSPWARDVVLHTIGQEQAEKKDLDWMPHGLSNTWQPGEKMDKTATRVGVVATNQERKDWSLVAQACSLLKDRIPNLRLWWHVDTEIRAWSIPALLEDFNLKEITEVTSNLYDAQMCACYQMCDVTLHPGLGEGFGYPIFESLACGVPAIHGDYGGGASILKTAQLKQFLLTPHSWRIEGQQNSLRPSYLAERWADMAQVVIGREYINLQENVEHLRWPNLWPRWSKWFEEGL